MVNQLNIQIKYKELHKKYADQHIDDCDVFVRSRVIEYFLNKSKETADEIVILVEKALSDKNTLFSAEEKNDDDTVKQFDTLMSKNSKVINDKIPKKRYYKVIPLLLSAVTAGILTYILKKRKK